MSCVEFKSLKEIKHEDWGVLPYREALSLQLELREKRIAGKICDHFITVIHPPVFTLGRRDCEADFISTRTDIKRDGIEIVKTDRGGRVTYHGPGQIVGYFIVDITSKGVGVKMFVNLIEKLLINSLAGFGIEGKRDEKHPGIWIGRNKIAAIGLNVSRGVTMHGFALNVDLDLSPYRHITACGIKDRGVTSMKKTLSKSVSLAEVKVNLVKNAGKVFT